MAVTGEVRVIGQEYVLDANATNVGTSTAVYWTRNCYQNPWAETITPRLAPNTSVQREPAYDGVPYAGCGPFPSYHSLQPGESIRLFGGNWNDSLNREVALTWNRTAWNAQNGTWQRSPDGAYDWHITFTYPDNETAAAARERHDDRPLVPSFQTNATIPFDVKT